MTTPSHTLEVRELIPKVSDDVNSFLDALNGNNGTPQKMIAEEGLRWINLLLKKNKDYGSSVFMSPLLCTHLLPSTAILVRMSDKIQRLEHLLNFVDEPEVEESTSDTIMDLGAYCLLYLVKTKLENYFEDDLEEE